MTVPVLASYRLELRVKFVAALAALVSVGTLVQISFFGSKIVAGV
jgi:hypothetical protein